MRTPEEIKKALKICMGDNWHCYECPYANELIDNRCDIPMYTDVLAYIEQLEEQIMCMKIQMRGDCGVCKHRSGLKINAWAITMSKTCEECIMQESRPNWEYEGLPVLPKKGES